MHCKTCGCHFDDDFEETLEPECTMWKAKGFSKSMSVEHKRALWDAFFAIPVDEIADATGVITEIKLSGNPSLTYTGNQFEEFVYGYGLMTDREKRDFQKRLFKFQYNQPAAERMAMYLRAMSEAAGEKGWGDLVTKSIDAFRSSMDKNTEENV